MNIVVSVVLASLENITLFSESINMERVIHVCNLANIHNDIIKLPMKYRTMIGSAFSNLSGGQKQRILLARALYRNPKILFLDEATSNLDDNNEIIINDNLRKMNITRIVIAHRTNSIILADRVIEL